MRKKINVCFLILIPLLVIGINANIVPFWVAFAALIIRLIFADKHSVGVFLLLFGGILGSTIRFEIPSLPIYGLLLNLFGLFLIMDVFGRPKKSFTSSLQMLIITLVYFLFTYVFSPNIGDIRATDKIITLILNGFMSFFAYFAFIHSPKIDNEVLAQSLFLVTILFFIHNMKILGVSPNGFFDYEWQRNGATALFRELDEEKYVKFVNYQVVGMNALFGLTMYLSQLNYNTKKAILYCLVTLQLVLSSGARQAIFGFFIILILSRTIFNNRDLSKINISKVLRYVICGSICVYAIVHILPLLGVDYLTDTLSEGDKGREMLRTMGWELFFRYPLFGAGLGGFNHVYPGMLYPHNFIIEVLCECGIIGAVFLLFVLIVHWRHQKLRVLYLTNSRSFIFLILAAEGISIMVSGDLSNSISLFSAVFACGHLLR